MDIYYYAKLENECNLLYTLVHPDNLLVSHIYEKQRNFISSINASRCNYSYDNIGNRIRAQGILE